MKVIDVSQLYESSETWKQFEMACDEIGWSKVMLVQQCLQAFFKINGSFYANAGLVDAKARGMEERDYYSVLRDKGESGLDQYLEGRPAFERSPLDDTPFNSALMTEGRRYGRIRLSNRNFVLLRILLIVDRGSLVEVVSRLVKHHFDRYWETNYLPQIQLDRECRLI